MSATTDATDITRAPHLADYRREVEQFAKREWVANEARDPVEFRRRAIRAGYLQRTLAPRWGGAGL